jgi:hypothetical protein
MSPQGTYMSPKGLKRAQGVHIEGGGRAHIGGVHT